ncbi:Pkinase-domain-containing protein [Meredithblackwellia eburnea MCA 4105]
MAAAAVSRYHLQSSNQNYNPSNHTLQQQQHSLQHRKSTNKAPPLSSINNNFHQQPQPLHQQQQQTITTTAEKDKEREKDTKTAKLTLQWGEPPTLVRRDNKDILQRGQLLGEGGFARVYVATEPSGSRKALKVISKEQLKSSKNKTKLFAEIKIHQSMKHANIINFEHCFEDSGHVYMQLELCENGSLLDTLRRRRRYTEPEARFYLLQLLSASAYMHDSCVIHRDLKLGNLMLDRAMNLKVGDFGLAALVKDRGERKRTICGTPNYIAPEILFDTTNGHSFEVDVWSIGVILYTLLVGKPPFQTKDVKNIYRKIKDLNYVFPPEVDLSPEAVDLISAILTTQPDARPSLGTILLHPFFTTGPFPSSIPHSALSTPPDFRNMSVRTSLANFEKAVREMGLEGVWREAEEEWERERERERQVGAAAGEGQGGRKLDKVEEEEEEEEVEPAVLATSVKEGEKETVKKERPRVEEGQQRRRATPSTSMGVPVATSAPEKEEEEKEKEQVKQVEKEVRQVLQPGSPISELLRSARKPLLVSPRTSNANQQTQTVAPEPKETVQRRMVAEARSAVPVKEHRRHATTVSSTVVGVVAEKDGKGFMVDREKVRSTVIAGADPVSTRYPARELYESTWRSLDAALTVATTADIDALPSPTPLVAPKVFITSWVDYTHKYGTAYSLTDGSAGLYFNDSTTMVLSPDKIHFDYISNRKGNVYSRRHYTTSTRPTELERKAYLLEYFEDYMSKTLLRDVDWTFVDKERTRNMDFLVKYYRMKNAIVFKMSNDVLQFNFYDHTKILLTQNGAVITFIDPDFSLRTYSLHAIFRDAARYGYYQQHQPTEMDAKRLKRLEHVRFLVEKLEYCRDVLKNLSSRKPATAGPATTVAP